MPQREYYENTLREYYHMRNCDYFSFVKKKAFYGNGAPNHGPCLRVAERISGDLLGALCRNSNKGEGAI